jgi:aspartate-semialdehyde dehydrogenase
MHRGLSVAIAGATGAVGRELVRCLVQRHFPYKSLKLLASHRSVGRAMDVGPRAAAVQLLEPAAFEGVDIAFFACGGDVTKTYAPQVVKAGATLVDNSSAFRMTAGVPLVVPEINGEAVWAREGPVHGMQGGGVLANPNCSTILLALALAPLEARFGLERVVAATYQAASGAGDPGMQELEMQAYTWASGEPCLPQDVFGRQYLWNVFSHDSPVDAATGVNEEERKMVEETRKILGRPDLAVAATCVRVPVLRAHCEAVTVTLQTPAAEADVRAALEQAEGVLMVDDRAQNKFPEPLDATDTDEVLVGRLRPDLSQPDGHGYQLFLAGDQLRKGAALNAVQIAELLLL